MVAPHVGKDDSQGSINDNDSSTGRTTMALKRLHIDNALKSGSEVRLEEEQSRYLGRVLRLRVGDTLNAFNGEDGEFEASIAAISKTAATLVLGEHRATNTESALKVHLVQGISRGERMDFVVQKATELGVKRLSPVLTEYGVVKLDAERADKRRAHWQKVATSACEQCGRIRPPLIDTPVPLKAWFGDQPQDADSDLVLRPAAPAALTSLAAPKTKVCILIGPEGGLSPAEYEDAAVAGFTDVSLGPRILRTETAAIAAIAVMQSLWGDLRLD